MTKSSAPIHFYHTPCSEITKNEDRIQHPTFIYVKTCMEKGSACHPATPNFKHDDTHLSDL